MNLTKQCKAFMPAFFISLSGRKFMLLFTGILMTLSTNAGNISFEVQEIDKPLTEKIIFAESLSKQMQKDPTDNESLAKLYAQLGELYFYDEQYPKAIDYYLRSLVLRDKNMDEQSSFGAKTPWLLIDIGNVLYRMGEFPTAKTIYLHALQVFRNKKDMRGVATSLNNVGLCLISLEKYKEAYSFFKTSYQLSNDINDDPCRYASGIYIALSLRSTGKNEEALQYHHQIESISLRPEDEHLDEYHLLEMGIIYKNLNKMDSAKAVLLRLVNNKKKPESTSHKIEALLNLSLIEQNNGQISQAIEYGKKAWELIGLNSFSGLKTNIAHQLYTLYKTKDDYKEALYFHEQFEEAQNERIKAQMNGFVEDYNRKIDRISNYWEKKQYQIEQRAIVQEKNNQMQLSFFLIATSLLLIIMIISGKGTETRINALQEYIGSLTLPNKRTLIIATILYFSLFHLIFSPVGISRGNLNIAFVNRLYPGIITILVLFVSFSLFFKADFFRKWFHGKCQHHYLISFGITFILVFFALSVYYMGYEAKGLNFLLSLFMLVLASFIFPVYVSILIIEKVIIRHFENQAAVIAGGLAQKNAEKAPEEEKITLESEKTSGKLEFLLKNLLFVESQGNYCMFYLDTPGGLRKKMLHTTMKSVDNQLSGNKYVVRCHKSFIVNIQRIKNVSGNSRGYELHFGEGVDVVPVSRGYQNEVMVFIRDYIDGNS